jgi:hypothetical protein
MPATNCTANTPRLHQYAFSASGGTTFATRIAALNFGLKSTTNYAKDEGNNGTLWSRNEDFVIDKTAVAGPVSFNPRPNQLRAILPLILGGTFATNTIKVAPTCPFYRVGHLDNSTIAQVYSYIDCVTSKATFSSSSAQGGMLNLAMDIEACQSSRAAVGTWPTLTLSTQQPFVHSQSALTVNGVVQRISDASIVIDNQLIVDEFYNSRYRGDMPQDGQMIQLTHTSPFDTADDLAMLDLTGAVAGSMVYTAGPFSLTFTFPALRLIPSEPDIGGRGQRVTNSYTWEAVLADGADSTAAPLTVTLDDTP